MATSNTSSSGSGSAFLVAPPSSSSSDMATAINMSTSASAGSSSSSSSDADPVGSVGDTCSWYADQSCAVPRACADCLNTALLSGDSCALDSTLGLCVSVSSVASSSTDDATARYYSAAKYSYCSGEDASCASCRAEWLQQFQAVGYVSASSAVCHGDSGCVCMAACVNPQWSTTVLSDQCALFGGVFSRVMACIGIGGCVIVLLLFVCACLRKWTREHEHPTFAGVIRRIYLGESDLDEQRRRREAELEVYYFRRYGRRHRRDEHVVTRGDRALALPAWSSMREALIESEKRRDQQIEAPLRLTRAPSIVTTDVETDHVEIVQQQQV